MSILPITVSLQRLTLPGLVTLSSAQDDPDTIIVSPQVYSLLGLNPSDPKACVALHPPGTNQPSYPFITWARASPTQANLGPAFSSTHLFSRTHQELEAFESVYCSNLLYHKIFSKFDLSNYPSNSTSTTIFLALTRLQVIPLTSIILKAVDPQSISLSQSDNQLHSTFRDELHDQLQNHIIRQTDQIDLSTNLFKTFDQTSPTSKLSFHVLLTEPVLQGSFEPDRTSLVIVTTPHSTSSDPTTSSQTSTSFASSTGLDDDELEIDEDFLAHSVLDQSSRATHFTRKSLDQSPPNFVYQRIASLGHLVHPFPLTARRWSFSSDEDDVGGHCVMRTTHLSRIGARHGDLVVVSRLEEQHRPDQRRLLKVFADDRAFSSHDYNGPHLVLLLPPALLFNLLGIVSPCDARRSSLVQSARLKIFPASVLGLHSQFDHHPIIKSLTLARISSPQSLMRTYQPQFLRGLKKHFEERRRCLLKGDLITIGIDESLARFGEARKEGVDGGAEEMDIELLAPVLNQERPTMVIYFKVTHLEFNKTPFSPLLEPCRPSEKSNDLIRNEKLMLLDMIERGELGGIVDHKLTKLVQTGLEYGFVPDVHSWVGINGLSPLSLPRLVDDQQTITAKLYDYLSSAQLQETRNYDLNLTILLSGPRGIGKKTLIRRLTSSVGYHFLEINCFDILSETETKTAANLKVRFERALSARPCILLLDQLDGLVRKTQSLESGQEPGLISILKELFEEVRHDQTSTSSMGFPLVIVGTVTDLDRLPLGVSNLFKTQLNLKTPSEAERRMILEEILKKDLLGPDLNIKAVATETAGLVPNDLVHLVSRARKSAIDRVGLSGVEAEGRLSSSGVQILWKDMEIAIAKARLSYSESIGAPKIPKVSWDDIGGLAEAKDEILETVQLPIEHPELFKKGLKQRSGLLFYGPPGTGKTLLAKAVATSCGLNFFSVKGPELLNMYIGESEANVRRVFEKARGARPCVIFFDELDSIAPKRGNQGDSGGVMDRIVSQLLAELDGMSTDDKVGAGEVVVIGATNRPDLLDPALLRPGRFDKLIYLGIPNTRQQKSEIIKALTRQFRFEESFDLNWLLDTLENEFSHLYLTGADYYALCSEALMRSMGRKIEQIEDLKKLNRFQEDEDDLKTIKVGKSDFLDSLNSLTPSISLNELKHYKTVQEKFGGLQISQTEINERIRGKGKSREI